MKHDIRDIFEHIIALVNEFAKRFGLSDKQAYRMRLRIVSPPFSAGQEVNRSNTVTEN